MVRKNHLASVLTVRQVARLLNIHVNTVRRWSDQGTLRASRIGPRGDRRFVRRDIAALLPHEASGNSEGQK